MSEEIAIVTLRQRGRSDSNKIYFKRRLKNAPVLQDLETAYNLLNKFLHVKGFVYSEDYHVIPGNDIKVSPNYYLYYCLIEQGLETGVTVTRDNLFVHPEHVIKVAGPEVIADKLADYLSTKVRVLFLERLKDENKRIYNTVDEQEQVYTQFQYSNRKKQAQLLSKPLIEYLDISELEEKIKEKAIPAKFLNKLKISV